MICEKSVFMDKYKHTFVNYCYAVSLSVSLPQIVSCQLIYIFFFV
jgi:hypothetical protein